ncbi:MAG: MFS transporter [Luteibaculaceae bacterium]
MSLIQLRGSTNAQTAWAFYDWANSVYALVITTAIFPIFYEAVTTETVVFLGKTFINTELYMYVSAASFLAVSFISPLLSGIADYIGNKRIFLKFFCYLGSTSCAGLFFFTGENLLFGMLCVFFASIGYWGSIVFYNAYLPEIAFPEEQDKVSAKGYALGYVGSAFLLILNLLMIMVWDFEVKYCFLTVAIWWAGFAQFTFSMLHKGERIPGEKREVIFRGIRELKRVFKEVKSNLLLKRYLVAFFVISLGVQTVILVATLFGAKEIDWGTDEGKSGLIISVLIIQFIAIAGSYFFSYLSARLGNIVALIIGSFIWAFICLAAYGISTPVEFYLLAACVGLVMGGVQSLSRSTYSKMLPETTDHASYFSFYDVTEKIAIVLGSFTYGYIEGFTGSMRNSVLMLMVFFIVAFFLFLRVPGYRTFGRSVKK